MLTFSILILTTAFAVTNAQTNNKEVRIDGTFMIGGLNQVHEYNPGAYTQCGPISPSLAIMSQAHLFSTDFVNGALFGGKNFTIGAHLVDTCYSEAVALEQSVKFIRDLPHSLCYAESYYEDKAEHKGVSAVTGTFASGVGMYANYLFQPYCIPLVSSQSTAGAFDNTTIFPNFLRTVPSDKYQAQAVFELLLYMNWTRVVVFYESYPYGKQLWDEFETIVAKSANTTPICIHDAIELAYERPTTSCSREDCKAIWDELEETLRAPLTPRVIVLFSNFIVADHLFKQMYNWTMQNEYQFVGVDGWGALLTMDDQIAAVANGSITTEPELTPLNGFEEHLDNLTLEILNDTASQFHNPWLVELIELDDNNCIRIECEANLTLQKPYPDGAIRRGHSVFQAIYTIGVAVKKLQEKFCPDQPKEYCDNLKLNLNGSLLYNTIKASGYDIANDSFHFYKNETSAVPKYYVMQLQNTEWNRVGQWDITTEPKFAEFTGIEWFHNASIAIAEEVCSPTCTSIKEYKEQREKHPCCTHCESCTSCYHFINESNPNKTTCEKCPLNTLPNETTYRTCEPLNVQILQAPDVQMGILFGVCGLGILLTTACAIVLYSKRHTPMIQAATGDLLPVYIISLYILFLCPILFLPTNSETVCGAAWITLSIGACLGHLATLAKALRLGRPNLYVGLLAEMLQEHTFCYKQTVSKFLIAGGMIIHVCILSVWIVLQPPKISHIPSEGTYVVVCSSNHCYKTLIPLMVVPVISLVATAVLLRRALKSPYLYAIYQTQFALGGWLCLVVTYILLDVIILTTEKDQIFQLALYIQCLPVVTAYIFWLSIILPLVYAVLFKKRQNVELCVKRKRAQLFVDGAAISIITPVTSARRRGRSEYELPPGLTL